MLLHWRQPVRQERLRIHCFVMNGIYFLFGSSYANAKGIATDALYGVILGVIGTQGVPEAIVAAVLTVAIGKALLHIRR